MKQEYQYLVKEITIEPGGYRREKQTENTKEVVVFNFNNTKVPIFKFAPKYCEIQEWLRLTVKVRGKEEVERELGVKIQ